MLEVKQNTDYNVTNIKKLNVTNIKILQGEQKNKTRHGR